MVRKTQPPGPIDFPPNPSRSTKIPNKTPMAANATKGSAATKGTNGHLYSKHDDGVPREAKRRPAPSQFDLIVTFADDQQARDALLALRRERFRSDQAVLLTRGPLGYDEFELATEALRAESYVALGIVIVTELAIGVLLGAVIGWLAGLFHFGPAVGPVWQPILIVAGVGLCSALVVAALDIRRWRRVHLPSPGAAAVALRLSGRDAPARLAKAQEVLAQFGGHQDSA